MTMARRITEKIERIRRKTHKGVDSIMDKAHDLGERGQENLERMKEGATTVRNNVDGYIKQNPEKSALIAAGIGAIVGAVLAAAIMRRKD